MEASDVFAIAAHLHVLLRRKTGRVTDTEWLATNADYAQAIVRFSREKAASDGHAELLTWADKLATAIPRMGTAAAPKPLLQTVVEQLRAGHAASTPAGSPQSSGFMASTLPSVLGATRPEDGDEARYVGGIR